MKALRLKMLVGGLGVVFLLSGFMLNEVEAGEKGCKAKNGRVKVAVGSKCPTITEALNIINPTAANPFVIEVLPGTYTENVVMKSYVHLKGSGREVTTIQVPPLLGDIIKLDNLTNVEISGFTITGGRFGIYNISSSPTIRRNTFSGTNVGIYNDSSSPMISGNNITGNNSAIGNFNSSSPTISGNIITANTSTAIVNHSSSPTISDNSITGSGIDGIQNQNGATPIMRGNTITGNSRYGINIILGSSPTITYSRITGNGLGDIAISSDSTPHISFNTYDLLFGLTGVGQYNVNSNGGPASAP